MMDKYFHHSKSAFSSDENSNSKNFDKKQNLTESNLIAKKNIPSHFKNNKIEYSPIPLPLVNKDATNVFDSEEKQGIIGEFSEEESDNPADNFFTINIPEIKTSDIRAYLVYDLFGLDSYTSVSRSINKSVAFGGSVIVPNSKWSVQKEEINVATLNSGKNSILFTSPSNGIKYKIKNVKIVFEKENSVGNISTLLSGDQLYIKGVDKYSNTVVINNKTVNALNGEFESIISITDSDKSKGYISISSNNGLKEIKLPKNTTSFKVINEERFNPMIINISKDTEYNNNYENTNINIEKNSVENTANIQILKLRKRDYPSVANDIKTLTPNASAYRVELQSGELNKKIKFSFPYDEKKLGNRSAKEIKAFYFDYSTKKWKVDPTSIVDTEKKIVTVENNGNGDYINGIISVPESPQLNAFAPTSISGLKPANPLAGVQNITPPTANHKGSANVTYPIIIPSGRKGMQPNISISYDSDKSNGWMGEGWDVNVSSSITLDTRWGSPKFDSQFETELYTLDGSMLVYDGNYLPHRHNDISETSTVFTTKKQKRDSLFVNNKKTFYLRKNHDFTKIERYGGNPNDYRWIVTSTNGTKTYYGGDENGVNHQSVIKGSNGNIVTWGIWKVKDVHGNTIDYEYDNLVINGLSGENENLNNSVFFHIKHIFYTGYNDKPGLYSVNFERENDITRQDISISGKLGIKIVEPYKLNNIIIKYDNEIIRKYELEYTTGEFYKTLLSKITELDKNNEFINRHSFDYYNDIKDENSGVVQNFNSDVNVSASGDDAFPILPQFLKPSKISANNTFEWGASGRAPGIGLDFLIPGVFNAYGHIMASFNLGHSEAEAKKAQELMDFDGDGIQDLIYRRPSSGLHYRPGILSNGVLDFGQSKQIKHLNSNFSYTKTKTNHLGYDAGIKVFGLGFNFSQIWATSKSETSSFVLDANSDGVMDVVKDGEVIFGRINPNDGNVEMTKYSDNTENMVIVADAITEHGSPLEGSWQDVSNNDVVKMWIAPRSGYIRITDQIMVEGLGNKEATYSIEMVNPNDPTKNVRVYLIKLTSGLSNLIEISKYNSYFNLIQSLPPYNNNNHLAINDDYRLYVNSGDKVFIRLHKNETTNYRVYSNPNITYIFARSGADMSNTFPYEQDGFNVNSGSYAENFLLNNHSKPISLPDTGSISFSIPQVYFPKTNDSITFKVIKTNTDTNTDTILYNQTYSQSDVPFYTNSFSGTFQISSSDIPCVIRFVVESDSHTAFVNSNWNRIKVYYTPSSGSSYTYHAVPDYPSHYITEHKEKVNISQYPNPGPTEFKVEINKNIPAGATGLSSGSFYYIIKKLGRVLAKRRVILPMNNSGNIIEVDMITNQSISGISPITIYTGDIANYLQDDAINIQVYCKTKVDQDFYKAYSNVFQNKPFNIYYGGNNTVLASVQHTSINSSAFENIGQFYKNWTQILYNEFADVVPVNNTDGYVLNPNTPSDEYGRLINLDAFQQIDTPVNLSFPACDNLPTQQETAECIAQQINNSGVFQNPANFTPKPVKPLEPYISTTIDRSNGEPVEIYSERWIGLSPEQYSMATSFKDDESATGYFNPQAGNPDAPDDLILQGDVDTKMYGINKKYYSKSRTNTLSGSLIVVSGSNASSVLVGDGNITLQDYMDMNGDGYPDVVYKDAMQVTQATGGHGGLIPPFTNAYISNTNSYSNSAGLQYSAGNFIQTGASSKNGEIRSSTSAYNYKPLVYVSAGSDNSTGWSVQANMNYDSKDTGESFWMDVNGDGMPDRITGGGTGNMKYQINLGSYLDYPYNFKNAETFSSGPVGSVGLGYGFDFSSISNIPVIVNANIAAQLGSSKTTFEDINADGLSDVLVIGSDKTFVRYNLGNKFTEPIEIFKNGGGIDYNNESKAYKGGLSVGVGFYYTFPIVWWPIPPIPLIYLKIGGQASGNIGLSIAEVDKAFKDMNGDGFPDLVVSKSDGFIVNHSKIGRTNKLKKVNRSVSDKHDYHPDYIFTIDYEFTKPSYNDPNGRLVMKEAKILNPDATSTTHLQSTPGKDMITRFKYENGHYDRREREFFGFEKVISEEIQGINTIYRSQKQFFYNNSYHLNGILKRTESYGSGTNLLSVVENTYKLYKFKNSNTKIDLSTVLSDSFDTGGKEGRKMATALLENTKNITYETGGSIETNSRFTYNEKGQIKLYKYNSPTAAYDSEILYHPQVGNNIINIPQSITVYVGGELIRYRETEIDPSNGNITKVIVMLNNSENAETSLSYDMYGNIARITYPPNETSQQYELRYEYDNILNKYVTIVSDSFDMVSSSDYDARFDVITASTDTAGNVIKYSYDEKGRIISVLGPKEDGVSPFTVEYQYHEWYANNTSMTTLYSYSITKNFDPQNPSNTIDTIVFADGLGRTIQVKKDILVDGQDKMSVSGKSYYDQQSRVIRQDHPTSETKYYSGSNGNTNEILNLSTSTYYTTNQYDVRDRVISFTDELFNTTYNSYYIDNNLLKNTVITNQNNSTQLKTETFFNAEGKTAKTINYLGSQQLTTNFMYNGIGELLSSTDPENMTTLYSYDFAGRKTSLNHPDRGQTKYTYDKSSNLIRLGTTKIEAYGNPPIIYNYDQNRLVEIRFPDTPNGDNSSNVYYKYAGPGSGNNTGKLIYKGDGSGETTYEYGNMGEVINESKFINGYNIPTPTINTSYTYDTWNRITNIIYPDGEEVKYEYDLGGNLKRIFNQDEYEYVKNIRYDHFEQKTFIEYGNNISSDFTYSPADRKLTEHRLYDNGGTNLLRNNYTYDFVGNITNLTNTAGIYDTMGGDYNFNYKYDQLNRLSSSDGNFMGDQNAPFAHTSAGFDLQMNYTTSGSILSKRQNHAQNNSSNQLNTFDRQYHYFSNSHKVKEIANMSNGDMEYFDYDKSGNVIKYSRTGSNANVEYMFWDEQERLRAINIESGVFQYYVYDDKGERIIKYNLAQGPQLYQNGELVDPGSMYINDYKLYPNPYVVLTSDMMMTKHYFIGSQRIASRLIDFDFSYMKQSQSPKSKDVPDPENDFKTYLNKAGIDFKNLSTELSRGVLSNADVYYLHGDHLGTATFVTNSTPRPTQFFLNLPFGETMAEQMIGAYDNPYKFNAKELDAETGLYYYGARYYNPSLSIWYGVDPLAEKFPSWSPYNYTFDNPVRYIDPDGRAPDDFVRGKNGNIYWDKNANSQATTKAGETYLGKTLNFTFQSYIDKSRWDVPSYVSLGLDATGVKLTGNVSITGRENANGELTSIVGKSSFTPGPTPIGTPRNYYPGEGGSNNVFDVSSTSTGININFEQHLSVSPIEEFGLNSWGFKIVDVAQKLDINYNNSNGALSVDASTNIFPSANLNVKGSGNPNTFKLMQYDQPSFIKTHTAPVNGATPTPRGMAPTRDTSYYPSKFYKRN